jgi:hypothetical protein
VEAAGVGGSNCKQITLVGVLLLLVLVVYRVQCVLPIGKRRRIKRYITICRNFKYAVGTNNSTVEQLVVVMRERTTTLESEQQHQMFSTNVPTGHDDLHFGVWTNHSNSFPCLPW